MTAVDIDIVCSFIFIKTGKPKVILDDSERPSVFSEVAHIYCFFSNSEGKLFLSWCMVSPILS